MASAYENTSFSENRQSHKKNMMFSKKKNETKQNNTVETSVDEQIKTFYNKSLTKFGFKSTEITNILKLLFDKEGKKEAKEEDKEEDKEEEENEEDEAFVKVFKNKKYVENETDKEKKKDNGFSSEDITNFSIILLTTINKWIFKNHRDEDNELPTIKEFRDSITNCPNLFSIPKDGGLPDKFIDIFANLGLVPKHFNIPLDKLTVYIKEHIEMINMFGAGIKHKELAGLLERATDPSKRLFTLSHNKLINLEQRKQMLTSFIIGCSMVSKPPAKIEFLPAKFIDVIAKVYPTIGSCVKAINSKKGINPTDCFIDWSNTKVGKTLLCDDKYKPKEDKIKEVFTVSFRVFTAIYNTMTNRNCFSQSHVGTGTDGKKYIFPFMPIDYIKHISHTFPAELFKTTVNEMTDHRFISTSFMMATIMTIVVAAFANPDKEVNKFFGWIDMAIEDYFAFIKPNKTESKEEKYERIGNANKALYEVIHYLNEIGEITPITTILTDDENKLFGLFFDGLDNLFPENKSKKKFEKEKENEKDNEKDKKEGYKGAGTDQYFNDFPGLHSNEDNKKTTTGSVSAWDNPLYA